MTILALYIQGDIYPDGSNNPAAVVSAITASKLTTPILGLCHVNCTKATCPNGNSPADAEDGDITFNDTLIIRNGVYVGDASWPATIKSLRAGQVSKIFASFGGWGVPDYSRIGALMAKYGVGKDSPIYKNFACLKATLGIDGIDFDDEDNDDPSIDVKFAEMLLGLGYEITFCPFGDAEFWAQCIQGVGAKNISWLNLQCYAGGKSNAPGDWTGMGVAVVAGVCANCCCTQTTCSASDVQNAFALWTSGQGEVSNACWEGSVSGPTQLLGGFIWTYGEVAGNLDQYVNAMNSGLSS